MPRIRNPTKLGRLLILLLVPALAGAEPATPDALKLLDDSLSPEVSFRGRMMVTHWFGKQTRAEEVEVYHGPGNLYRREFLSPDGIVTRVQVSDGDIEENLLVKHHKVVSGDAVKSYEKVMKPEREMELLLANYEISVSTKPDEVAGRKAWVLELKPKIAGKPWQKLWIDQEHALILENKRYLPKKRFAVLSRYSRIEVAKQLDPKLFELSLSSRAVMGGAHGLEPDFKTLEELKKATGKDVSFPLELPAGFAFESCDDIHWGPQIILHARYTDGLAVLSLFQTDKPVRLPAGATATIEAPSTKTGSIRWAVVGKVLSWQHGKHYFTLMGDVSTEVLQEISAKLK